MTSPILAFAAVDTSKGAAKILKVIGDLTDMSIGILVTLALFAFFWGLVRYLFKLGGSKTPDNGRSLMIYGIIALFVMVSIWGIIHNIGENLGIDANASKPNIGNLLP